MPIHHNLLGAVPVNTERIFKSIADEKMGATSCSAHENILLPGAQVPQHRHALEEVIVCLEGNAECSFEGADYEGYQAGSVLIIPANTLHSIRNCGTVNLRQISFFAGKLPNTQWTESAGSVE
jgi:quercetin dioxygenase-like cupin family protein